MREPAGLQRHTTARKPGALPPGWYESSLWPERHGHHPVFSVNARKHFGNDLDFGEQA